MKILLSASLLLAELFSPLPVDSAWPGGLRRPNGAVSLQDAIAKQLGLKLQAREKLLPVVVIDSMLQMPREN